MQEAASLAAYVVNELLDEEAVEFARSVLSQFANLTIDPIDLKAIQVGDYFRYPVIAALIAGDREAHEHGYLPFAQTALRSAPAGSRRHGVKHEKVAEVYLTAFALNKPVIEEVAERFHWHLQTAKNRIREARRRGLLPATVPRRARG